MFLVPLPPSVLMTNNLDGLLISLGTRRIRELVFYLLWLMHLGPPFRPDVPGPITTVLLSLNTGRVWLDDLYGGSATSSREPEMAVSVESAVMSVMIELDFLDWKGCGCCISVKFDLRTTLRHMMEYIGCTFLQLQLPSNWEVLDSSSLRRNL